MTGKRAKGPTRDQLKIIQYVARFPGVSQKEIMEAVTEYDPKRKDSLRRPFHARINRIRDRGFIRDRHPNPRRSSMEVTPAGVEALERAGLDTGGWWLPEPKK